MSVQGESSLADKVDRTAIHLMRAWWEGRPDIDPERVRAMAAVVLRVGDRVALTGGRGAKQGTRRFPVGEPLEQVPGSRTPSRQDVAAAVGPLLASLDVDESNVQAVHGLLDPRGADPTYWHGVVQADVPHDQPLELLLGFEVEVDALPPGSELVLRTFTQAGLAIGGPAFSPGVGQQPHAELLKRALT